MRLDTITLGVTPNDALRIISAADHRKETVQLMPIGPGLVNRDSNLDKIRFEMYVDGVENCVIFQLNRDGTWKAEAPFVLGEEA